MATLRIEIRAGEGGDDAKSLVAEQTQIYQAYVAAQGLKSQVTSTTGSV